MTASEWRLKSVDVLPVMKQGRYRGQSGHHDIHQQLFFGNIGLCQNSSDFFPIDLLSENPVAEKIKDHFLVCSSQHDSIQIRNSLKEWLYLTVTFAKNFLHGLPERVVVRANFLHMLIQKDGFEVLLEQAHEQRPVFGLWPQLENEPEVYSGYHKHSPFFLLIQIAFYSQDLLEKQDRDEAIGGRMLLILQIKVVDSEAFGLIAEIEFAS